MVAKSRLPDRQDFYLCKKCNVKVKEAQECEYKKIEYFVKNILIITFNILTLFNLNA